MPVFGLRPEHVVIKTKGDTGTKLTIYANQADAVAQANPLETVTTDAGQWPTSDLPYDTVWVRTPAGDVYQVTDLAAKADKAAVDEALARKADAQATTDALALKANASSLAAKADKTYVDDGLATKANASSLGAKADKTYVDTELGKKLDMATGNATFARTGKALTQDSLNRISPRALTRRGGMPRIMSLVTGGEDETTPAVSNCTVSADTVNYRVGARGWKMTMSAAVTAYAEWNPVSPAAAGQTVKFPAAQAVCVWVYLSDASKINYISPYLFLGPTGAENWNRASTAAPAQTLVNGWNLLRFKTADALATKTLWGELQKVRLYAVTTGACEVTVGHFYLECPEKAKMIFVLDRGYKTFVTAGGLADLRRLNVPVTWAVDCTYLGYAGGSGAATEVITEAELAQYAALGDSVSFHGWDGSVTSTMTDAQLRADTLKAIKWLQARGYNGRMWRAAWVQNAAPNPAAIQDLVLGQAHSSAHSVNYGSWPPIQMHNIPRYSINGQTAAQMDVAFSDMKKSNGLLIPYAHGINAAGGQDVTPAEWANFVTRLETALGEGWLEPTTFEALWFESGGQFGNVGGSQVATYTDATGAVVTKRTL